MLKNINLQLLADGTGAANSGTDTDAGKGDGANNAGKTDGEKDTGKTYTQADLDRIVTDRSERAGNSALMSLYTQNGMTEAEAKQAMADYKSTKAAQAEKDKGSLTAMQKKAEDAKAETEIVKAERFNDLIEARSESVAKDLGIDLAQLPYIKLDFSKVGKDDSGKPKKDDIKVVLEAALKAMPNLKAKEPAVTKGVASTTGGGAIGADDARMRRAFGLPATKKEK